VLAVNLRFQNELQKLHFLAIWQPLAEYVKAAEPVALAFEVLQADNDPCNIMVYERCVYVGPVPFATLLAAACRVCIGRRAGSTVIRGAASRQRPVQHHGV
jgi:hypothetical protein